MDKTRIYIGYTKIETNEEIFEAIIITPNPKDFAGKYYEITSDYGEGSIGYLLNKLKGGSKNVS